jgi:hypothetical protein
MESTMTAKHSSIMSRRGFCLCCVGGAAFTAAGEWLTPRAAFSEARGLVSLIKDSAAVSPIVTYKLRNNISVLEGSGGNVAVLTGPDGKVLVDAGIGVSRPQMTKALADLGADPVTHLINTHWGIVTSTAFTTHYLTVRSTWSQQIQRLSEFVRRREGPFSC